MTASKVYMIDFHVKEGDTILDKLNRLIVAAGIEDIDMGKKFVALKVHFGEFGNMSYLRPNYCKVVADIVKDKGGMPYLMDCNTLYVGRRKNAVEHLDLARLNGFGPDTTGCNVIIGDGLKGDDDIDVKIDCEHVKNAKIGRGFYDSDIIITLNHFKCHELLGFGGAVKNLGMGCASRRGKMEQHSAGKPVVNNDDCRGCGKCLDSCGSNAITITDKKASIGKSCVGCGMCVARCPFDAIIAPYDQSIDDLNEKMAEYAYAAIKGKPNFHISFIMDVSPFCDCHGDNDVPVIADIGILASYDPVALDIACADLANRAEIIPGSMADKAEHGIDVFNTVHSETKWRGAMDHAAEIGMGTTEYEIVEIK